MNGHISGGGIDLFSLPPPTAASTSNSRLSNNNINNISSSNMSASQESFGTGKRIYSIRNSTGGPIHFAWQNSSGSLLASSLEGSHSVYIYTRLGTTIQQIPLKGNCTGLAWDEDGDFLAIMTEGSSVLVLWDAHNKKLIEIESNIKDPGTCLVWSKTSKILAYTTMKGNLLVYNHQTLRKIPIIGKHSKKIVTAAWSNDNILALATIDNQLSINTIDGDAIKVIGLRGKPSDMKFGHIKEDSSNSSIDNTVSLIVGDKILYLLKVEDGSTTSPLELGFQQRYGNIVSHYWHGDGYILCSFSGGFIVMISSHHREIGSELVLTELKAEPLRASALSQKISKFAVCYGDSIVEIRDASNTNQIVSTINLYENKVRPAIKCLWSYDGQLIAIVTSGGDLHVFLTSVPMLGASYGSFIVQMSSLSDLTIHSMENTNSLVTERTIRLEIEPTSIAVSLAHFVVVVNNRAWFYSFVEVIENLSTEALFIKEYNSNINELVMNEEYVAARIGDKVQLHLIEEAGLESRDTATFPDSSSKKDVKITAHALTREFLIYGLDNGTLKTFGLEQWSEISSTKIPSGSPIKRIYVDESNCYILIVDRNGICYMLDVASDVMYNVPNFPTRHDGILWDMDEKTNHLFIVHSAESKLASLYALRRNTIVGTFTELLGQLQLFTRAGINKPLVLRSGKMYYQTAVGEINSTEFLYTKSKLDVPYTNLSSTRSNPVDLLEEEEPEIGKAVATSTSTSKTISQWNNVNKKLKLKAMIEKLKSILHFNNYEDAYQYCAQVNRKQVWSLFGREAMQAMELNYAIKAYAKLKNTGMVLDLKKIQKEDDFKISCGHMSILLGEYELAQDCFIESSEPYSALHMRMCLAQWDLAEDLATQFADDYVCEVTAKYALQEETTGNYNHALELFEKAYQHSKSYNEIYKEELSLCEAGIARNSIRCGNYKRGIEIALASKSLTLLKDCAEGLEQAKCYSDAAYLYEECQEWDKAASLYIRIKNWTRVGNILPRIRSARIYNQYAKAKESEGKYLEAAESYEKAKDIESACRMYTKLNRPDDAIRLVKKFKSFGGALVTARYFEECQDYDTAIRFLILSNCHEDALSLAFRYGKSELYVDIVQELVSGDEFGGGMGKNSGRKTDGSDNGGDVGLLSMISPEYKENIKKVAQYFEDQKDHVKAGKHFLLCGQYRKAFIILMKSASSGVTYDEENLLNLLTEATAACKDSHFEKQYIEFCLGEKDGIPKDPVHLLKYYLKVHKYSEAVTTSLVISSDYLRRASYKLAHSTLFTICKTLRTNQIHIPKDLMEEFITTHYYVLAIKQAAVGNNAVAAKLHLRLVNQIHKFPTHAIQIMSQTIIYCQKAGLQRSAMETCFLLMKPENRSKVPPQYKSKFETLIRKLGKLELTDAEDIYTSCPYCKTNIPSFELICAECRAEIPICIASGRHITPTDLTACPECNFPCIRAEMFNLMKVAKSQTCPLCDEPVDLRQWGVINDTRPYLYFEY